MSPTNPNKRSRGAASEAHGKGALPLGVSEPRQIVALGCISPCHDLGSKPNQTRPWVRGWGSSCGRRLPQVREPPTVGCWGRLGIGPPSTHLLGRKGPSFRGSEWKADYLAAWCLRASQFSAASDPGRPCGLRSGGCAPAGGGHRGATSRWGCHMVSDWRWWCPRAVFAGAGTPPPPPLAPIGRRSSARGDEGVMAV